jgi:hypothetical protein
MGIERRRSTAMQLTELLNWVIQIRADLAWLFEQLLEDQVLGDDAAAVLREMVNDYAPEIGAPTFKRRTDQSETP